MTTSNEGTSTLSSQNELERRIEALQAKLSAEEDKRKMAEARLNAVLESVVDAIISIDERGIVQSYNKAAKQIFGFSPHEVIGSNVCMLMPEDFRRQHQHGLERYLATGEARILGTCVEVTGQKKCGNPIPIELTISEIKIDGERQFTGIIRDITERKEAEERIRYLAHHDTLTGLPNRNMFNIHLERAISRAKRSQTDLALMYLDLDSFKPINDGYGHDAGDAVLKEIACRIKRSIRTTDTVARIGGDEFVVVLEVINGRGNAIVLAERLLSSVNEPVPYEGNHLIVSLSIGISIFPDNVEKPELLLKAADAAMYTAKATGRNTYCTFLGE